MPINLLHSLTGKGRNSKDAKIAEFIGAVIPRHENRRSHERIPFSRDVTIFTDEGTGPLPAMTRDISDEGIGLAHEMPIELGEVTVRIPGNDGKTVCARVNITWQRAPMKHWYMSGGTFVDVFIDDTTNLLD